jgi:hypothetical protein
MDAQAEVHNEETRLQDAGLLQISSVLAAPSVAPSAARSVSTSLHYDHYGRDGHVEAFCYMKKKAQKAQAHRSSQGTSGSSS